MNAESIIWEALQRPSPEERQSYLLEACGTDAALLKELQALVAAHEKNRDFLSQPAIEEMATIPPRPGQFSFDGDVVGSLIGPYKLLQKLGEGGMGIVWVAEQERPVKRRVALKLVKAGMDSAQVVRRFEAERQALAMMDHTNIAKVLDVGTTSNGRPYFVMELVKGVPITRYCDEVHASIETRLELFVQVCAAVQHAHQKGIIHRDIKPSNILVAMQDGKPVPKVIDFGVAKALHTRLADKTMYTEIGQVIGTLEYMAPEQAELSAMDIDTRADIYALGVVLYELLTGSTPITREIMKSAAIFEVLRIIKEEEPPKPSTRLTESKESLASLAALRKTDPKRLSNVLKGELDWVVLKALEKDRTCRYETANGLARDIQRYLADEVVEARPPSVGYRLRKFVRRNRLQVIAASLVLLALVAGVVGTTLGLLQARHEAHQKELARADEAEQRAIAQEKERQANAAAEKERTARLEEERQRKFAEAIATFVKFDFLALTSVEGQERFGGAGLDRNATLIDLLNRAAEKLKARTDLEPSIEAELCWIVGVNYRGAGEAAKAIPFLERAVKLRTEALGPDHERTLFAKNSLAVCYQYAGKLAQAMALQEETLRRQKLRFGAEHQRTILSMSNLAQLYLAAEKYEVAVQRHEEAFGLWKAVMGADHPFTLVSMDQLADCYTQAGKFDKALPLFEDTLKRMRAKLGDDHTDTIKCMSGLAVTHMKTGKLDPALALITDVLNRSKSKLGTDHPETLVRMYVMGLILTAMKREGEALPLFEKAFHGMSAKRGVDHRDTLKCGFLLAVAYRKGGKAELARPVFEQVVTGLIATKGKDHPETLRAVNSQAVCLMTLGQFDKSAAILEESLPLFRKKFSNDNLETQTAVWNLGVSFKYVGRLQEALPLLEEAHRLSKLPSPRWIAESLIGAYIQAGRPVDAAKLVPEALAEDRTEQPAGSPRLAATLAKYASIVLDAKDFVQAEPLLRECLTIREKKEPDVWTTYNTQSMLGGALLGQKKYADAEPFLLKGYEGMKIREKTIPPQANTRLPEALDRLIQLYTETNKPDEVKKWQAEKAKLAEEMKRAVPLKP